MLSPHADPEPGPDRTEQFDEMQRLLANAEEFASTLRSEIEELTVSRDRAVAAAQREAQDFIEEATQEAEIVLNEAQQAAKATVEQAKATADEIVRDARREAEQLVATNAAYRTALETAMRAMDDLPQIPAQPPAAPELDSNHGQEATPMQPNAEDRASTLTAVPTI